MKKGEKTEWPDKGGKSTDTVISRTRWDMGYTHIKLKTQNYI